MAPNRGAKACLYAVIYLILAATGTAASTPSRGVATLTLDSGNTVEGIGFHYYGPLGGFNVRPLGLRKFL